MSPEHSFNNESIKIQQLNGVNAALDFCMRHSSYYKTHLKGAVPLSDINEIQSLPFTEKDAVSSDQDAFLCVSEEGVADVSTTGGSTGKPLVVKLTQGDLSRLAYNEFLSFSVCGLEARHRVLLSVTLDKCCMAGLAYFNGLQRLGASVVRVGPGSPEMFLSIAQRTNPTAIVGVPSYLLRVHEYAKKHNFPLESLNIKKLILIGEPIRDSSTSLNSSGKQLAQAWQCSLHATYGATELQTSFCECEAGQGGHLHPELIYVEIVDDNGMQVQPGEVGEVVITTLGVEAMPLIRYKTGDISFLQTSVCACGLATPRLGPILSRKGHKLKIKGTTIYPQSIINILDEMREIDDYVIIITSAYNLSDEIEIKLCSQLPPEWISRVSERLKGQLKVVPNIVLSNAHEILEIQLSVSERKKIRIVDRRGARNTIAVAA